MSLCLVEFFLGLFATGTAPVVGQVFKGYAVVLSRVIDIATNGAYIFATGLQFSEIYFCKDCWNGIIKIHHALGLQILVALRGVGTHVNGGVVADEFTYSVQRLTGSGQVVINHRQFILIQGLVHI